MEEKKLNDDEKLLKQIRYLADRYGTANCIGNPSKNFFIDILDLIHRLQDEKKELQKQVEQLLEERVTINKNYLQECEEHLKTVQIVKELQKQVDELMRKIESYQHSFEYIQGYEDGKKQAVKELRKVKAFVLKRYYGVEVE